MKGFRRNGKGEGPGGSAAADHLKMLGWVLLLVYLFLGLFALISGRIVGLPLSFAVCGALALVVTVVFVSLLLLNVAVAAIVRLLGRRGR